MVTGYDFLKTISPSEISTLAIFSCSSSAKKNAFLGFSKVGIPLKIVVSISLVGNDPLFTEPTLGVASIFIDFAVAFTSVTLLYVGLVSPFFV